MQFGQASHERGNPRERRFAVTWRNRLTRRTTPVAVLDELPNEFRFQYTGSARLVEGFRPFVGFPDISAIYESERLWPFFNLRVMDRKRPDFANYLEWLGLPPNATSTDIISRSGGDQKGDTVSLAEAPRVFADGYTEATFLARGSRYVDNGDVASQATSSLASGEALRLTDDIGNEANTNALLLKTDNGIAIGWVPDLLIDFARTVRDNGGGATVSRNNGVNAPWHARFLVKISGHITPDASFYRGGDWPQ